MKAFDYLFIAFLQLVVFMEFMWPRKEPNKFGAGVWLTCALISFGAAISKFLA